MTTRLLSCLALIFLVGCPVQETRDNDPEEPMPSEKSPDSPATAVPADLLEQLRDDLAAHTGSGSPIAIRRAEAVVFNDGSLGCPEPGGMYTQALAAEDVNVGWAEVKTFVVGRAECSFEILIQDMDRLNKILKTVQALKGVYNVLRVKS